MNAYHKKAYALGIDDQKVFTILDGDFNSIINGLLEYIAYDPDEKYYAPSSRKGSFGRYESE